MLPQSFDFDRTHPTLRKLVYFGSTGLIGELLSAPLERAKVILQSKQNFVTKSFLHHRELKLTLMEINKSEGWTRLFYGLKASLDRQMFFNIIRFYGYYYAMDYIFSNPYHEYRYIPAFFSCLIGTSFATLATQASDLLKIKMQAEPIGNDNEKLVGPKQKVKKVVDAHGGKSAILFSGLKMNLLTQNVHAVLELFTFFAWKKHFETWQTFKSHYTTNTVSIILTNLMTTAIIAPLDYVHTHTVLKAINKTPVDITTCFKQIYKQEGVRAFYKGYIPLLYKTITMNVTIATILQYWYDDFERSLHYEELIQSEEEHRKTEEIERYKS